MPLYVQPLQVAEQLPLELQTSPPQLAELPHGEHTHGPGLQ